MIQATASQGFDADIQAVNHDGLVVLHRWEDGMLLVMTFDDEMPAFSAKPVQPGALLDSIGGKDILTSATGYVFHVAEPDVNGTFEFEGKRYSFLEIEDYVVWTDDGAVRRKYEEEVGKAMSEVEPSTLRRFARGRALDCDTTHWLSWVYKTGR